MEDQETDLGVHSPAPRIAFILDLVEGLQMPRTILLADPERIVGAGVSRLDTPRGVSTTLCCDSLVLPLNFRLSATADIGSSGNSVGPRDWRSGSRCCSPNYIRCLGHRIYDSSGGNCSDASVEGLGIWKVGWISREL